MIEHTWDRAKRLSGTDRVVTVMDQSHKPFVPSQCRQGNIGKVLWQPMNRRTASGVFLPLSYVIAHDPEAEVVIFPSDHFVYSTDRLLETIEKVRGALRHFPDRIMLLTAKPDKAETEYGWVLPGLSLCTVDGIPVKKITGFQEKPSKEEAIMAAERGGSWNTMITIAKVKTLWHAGCQLFPDMMNKFLPIIPSFGTANEEDSLSRAYDNMPEYDFSADFLSPLTKQLAMVAMNGILWNDWGRPQRIVETIHFLGKEPNFPWNSIHSSIDDSEEKDCVSTN